MTYDPDLRFGNAPKVAPRLLGAAWTAFGVVLVVVGVLAHEYIPMVIVIVVVGGMGYLLYRSTHLTATCTRDLLLVRNRGRSHRVHRKDVVDFFVDRVQVGGAGGDYRTVFAELRDGRKLQISACARSLVLDRDAQEKLEQDRQHLQEWLRDSDAAR